MSIYQDRVTYFKNLAKADPVIRHEVDGRIAFFDVDESEVISALQAKADTPFVWYRGLRISPAEMQGGLKDLVQHTLLFYSKIQPDDEHPDLTSATRAAKDIAFDLCEHWRRRIYTDGYDDSRNGAPFDNIDTSSLMIEEAQLFGDNYIGWRLSFTEVKINLDYHIPEEGYWD